MLLLDATGLLGFRQRHCPHRLVQRHDKQMLYRHHGLEARLLGPVGLVMSLGSEFIANADAGGRKGKSAEAVKQDCERKALARSGSSSQFPTGSQPSGSRKPVGLAHV